MKKRLVLLIALIAATAYADEIRSTGLRVIENPIQDGNLVMRVNDGGVKTNALTIEGSTGSVQVGQDTGDAAIGQTQGAAGTPTYSFIGDTDTGMYRGAANTIAFAANGILAGGIGDGTIQVFGSTATSNAGMFMYQASVLKWQLGVDDVSAGTDGFYIYSPATTTYGLRLRADGDAVITKHLITPSTGALINAADNNAEGAIYFAGSDVSTDTCDAICTGDRAGHGLSTSTAAKCLQGWNTGGGGLIDCNDASNMAKHCFCVGRRN